MNINKRKKMYRLGLLNDKPVQVQQVPVVPEVVELPIALKELPEEITVEVAAVEEVQTPAVDKKKVAKVKKVVEEDKPSDV